MVELLPVPWSSDGGDVVLRSTDILLSPFSRSFLLKLHLEDELDVNPCSWAPLTLVRSHSEPSYSSFLPLGRPRVSKRL